jgi:ribosomal protein S15P/S13E
MGKRVKEVKCEIVNLSTNPEELLALRVRIWQLHDAAVEQHINGLPLDYASKRKLAALVEQGRKAAKA